MTEIIVPQKEIHIVGGGTIEPIREHLALSARAYGTTARRLGELCRGRIPEMKTNVHLTRMADPGSRFETSDDLRVLAEKLVGDFATKVVFWNPAVCDFKGSVGIVPSGLHAERLKSVDGQTIDLTPTDKLVSLFRKESVNDQKPRKDIFTVGFKTTTGAKPAEQLDVGMNLLMKSSLNLVLANDTVTRHNMILTPEGAPYGETTDREAILKELVTMVFWRTQLSFTRSTVIDGYPVSWESEEVHSSLRSVVDHCRERGAYKPRNGVTTGHFAMKVNERTFLTSRRKTDFNKLPEVGLVKMEIDGDDGVLAYGARPSVGGQSQRIIYKDHPEMDCIVHFHCPPRTGAEISTVSQKEYECGSHECGQNTSDGLRSYLDGKIKVVYLDKHGPNIVFHHSVDPQEVIDFIEKNFDLEDTTSRPSEVL